MNYGRTIFLLMLLTLASVGVYQAVAEPYRFTIDIPKPDRSIPRGPSIAEASSCDLLEKVTEANGLLSGVTLKVGTKRYSWTEQWLGGKKTRTEEEKEFALGILHTESCSVEVIKITKRGSKLIAPEGWDIGVVRRHNGIEWNNWNTEFTIRQPQNAVVLVNVESFKLTARNERRIRTASGVLKVVPTIQEGVEYRIYAPYSLDVHTKGLADIGEQRLKDLVSESFSELRRKAVESQAFPGTLIVDVPSFSEAMFARLPLIEHMDLAEFLVEPDRTRERFFIILATNPDRAWSYSCNFAGACGLAQFTDRNGNGTYSEMVRNYPAAELIEEFPLGAFDHLNVMQAAILLHDNNVSLLRQRLSSKDFDALMRDPDMLEEALASAYNTGYVRPANVLTAHFRKPDSEWSDARGAGRNGYLVNETIGYIAKLRDLKRLELE